MTVNLIIVGLNAWERFTLPCIESIKENDPMMSIWVVDNGSQPPYPEGKPCYHILRNDELGSYAHGLNMGLKFSNKADWYVISNNDIIYHKYISSDIQKLDTKKLYGFKIYDKVFSVPFMSGWCMFFSWNLFDQVGYFDEKFSPLWFEDADFSIRAVKKGFQFCELKREEWGIQHLDRRGEREDLIHNNMKWRMKNRHYLEEKHHVTSI